MVSNIFYFHPSLGKIPILTNIFQMGWNHQLDYLPPKNLRKLRSSHWEMSFWKLEKLEPLGKPPGAWTSFAPWCWTCSSSTRWSENMWKKPMDDRDGPGDGIFPSFFRSLRVSNLDFEIGFGVHQNGTLCISTMANILSMIMVVLL